MFLLQHFPPGHGGLDVETMAPGDPAFPVWTAEESSFLCKASTGIRIDLVIRMYAVICCILSVV